MQAAARTTPAEDPRLRELRALVHAERTRTQRFVAGVELAAIRLADKGDSLEAERLRTMARDALAAPVRANDLSWGQP